MTNILGIYNEVPGEFGRWNAEQLGQTSLDGTLATDRMLEKSGIDYTTLRLPWSNDRNEVKYAVTHKNGVSASRQSVADLILRILANPTFGSKDSFGLADLATQCEDRPVY